MTERWWRIAAVLVAAFTLTVGACGDDPGPDDRPWAIEADEWTDAALDLLRTQGGLGVIPFYTEDATVDTRATSQAGLGLVKEGIEEIVDIGAPGVVAGPWWFEEDDMALDHRGFVLLGRGVEDRPEVPGPAEVDYAVVFDMAAGGISREIDLPSTEEWRRMHPSRPLVADRADQIARDWVEAWSPGGDLATIAVDDLAFEDGIGRVELNGLEAVETQRRLGPEVTWRLRGLASGAPAVYPHGTGDWWERDRMEGVALAVHGDDGTGCPGDQVVWLVLDESGRVEHERRFWGPEDARRCRPADELPSGWWTGRALPDPATGPREDLLATTGSFTVGNRTVAVHNGTPVLQSLTEWAMARFDRAGLALPAVTDVTFSQFSDYCDDVRGRAIPQREEGRTVGWLVICCFDESDVCRSPECADYAAAAKRIVLHELAHVWIDENVDAARQAALLELAPRADAWNGDDIPWERRGTEFAADVVAWGLLDEPVPLLELGNPSIEMRTAAFQLLTGHQPLQLPPE